MLKYKKLPDNILDKIPSLVNKLKKDEEIIALYLYGSAVTGKLRPLSDIDLAVLLKKDMTNNERFDFHLHLITEVSSILETDDFDLVLLNDAPVRFSYNIIKTGKLLFYTEKMTLINFIDKTVLKYLDFKYFKDEFDRTFQEKLGLSV